MPGAWVMLTQQSILLPQNFQIQTTFSATYAHGILRQTQDKASGNADAEIRRVLQTIGTSKNLRSKKFLTKK